MPAPATEQAEPTEQPPADGTSATARDRADGTRRRARPGRTDEGRPAAPGRVPWRARRPTRFAALVLAALAVGLALRVAIGLTDDAPSTDETAYLRSGESLVAGDGFQRDDRPELHFPPLVPFLLGVAGRAFADPHAATVVLTVVSGTATIVPLALLARRLAGPAAGAATAWVAALAPATSTTLATRGGGSEGEYALLVVLAVWLVVVAADRRGGGRLLAVAGAGLAVGLAYLTRPEGLALAAPLGLAVVALAVRSRWPGRGTARSAAREHGAARWGLAAARAAAVPAAAFAAPILACVVPYAMFLHSHTGAWELSAKSQDASLDAWHAVARGDREARDQVLYALDETGLEFVAGSTSLPQLARDDPGGYAGIVATNARVLARTLVNPDKGALPAWQLLPAPLWVAAAWGSWRLRRSPAMLVLVAASALPIATSLAFFVQPRYLVASAALATVPIGVALAALPRRHAARATAGALALLTLSVVLAFRGGAGWWHPSDHTSQRAAGEWVAARTGPDERVMARSMVVEYYADRTTIALPYTDYDGIIRYGRHYGVRYLVLDENTASRLRPQLSFLRRVDEAPGLRLVHEAHGEAGTTRIFAFEPAPPTDAPPGPRLGFVGDGPA